MQTVKDVVAAILIKDKKILIAQRGYDDPLALLWEFPGGKVEEGESPEESLVREMQEEFRIDVEVERFFASSLFAYDKGTIRLLGYYCRQMESYGRKSTAIMHGWRSVNWPITPLPLPTGRWSRN